MAKIVAVSGGTRFLISVGNGDALNERDVELGRVLDLGTRRFEGDEPLPVTALARIGYWDAPGTASEFARDEASALADKLLG